MYFRVENEDRYKIGKAMGLAIPAFGKTFDRFAPNRGLYQKVLVEARRSGEPLERIVEQVALSEMDRAAFVGGSAAFWSYLCEGVRSSRFPDRPSRLTCVFGLRTVEDADKLVEVFEAESATLSESRPWRRQDQVVYRVECEQPQDDRVYDMGLIDSLNGAMTLREAVDQLLTYWHGRLSKSPVPECLLVGATFRGEIAKTFR